MTQNIQSSLKSRPAIFVRTESDGLDYEYAKQWILNRRRECDGENNSQNRKWLIDCSSLLLFFAKLLHAKPKHAGGVARELKRKSALQAVWWRKATYTTIPLFMKHLYGSFVNFFDLVLLALDSVLRFFKIFYPTRLNTLTCIKPNP